MTTPSKSILDHMLEVADLGLPVFPLAPLKKTPLLPDVSWADIATTDPATILEWGRQNPRMNYGVVCGDDSDTFVIDIDAEPADKWWRAQGHPDGAIVQTPRGGRHLYYRTAGGVDVQTNQSKVYPGIDVRGSGGYVVGPGSMLPNGTYRGSLANIPMATPEMLAMLPEVQGYVSVPREGDKVDSATESESRQIAAAVAALEALPRPWVEGAGWRSTFYRCACWFSRMVNSPDYALTENGALSILLQAAPTDSEWGEREQVEQWISARKSTIGQYADLPTELIPNLLPFIDVVNLLPEYTTGGETFTDLLYGTAEEGKEYARRRTILTESFRAGLSPEQVATVGWAAKASSSLQQDPNGLTALWREVEKARASVAAEGGEDFEAPKEQERPSLVVEKVELLTAAERKFVAKQEWFGTRYLDWVATRVGLMNPPYHRLNRFIILSLVFSDAGFMPLPAAPVGLNLFGAIGGPTTSGKTEGLMLALRVIEACFPKDDSPDIGGNASPNALIEKLIDRDGKPSLFWTDEAPGLFKQMSGEGSWLSGLKELITKLYEGKVSMILRSGKKDVSGKNATTHFTAYFMGTTQGMVESIDEQFWISGLGPRFIWTEGIRLEATEDSDTAKQVATRSATEYDAMPKQWAAEFVAAKQKLKGHGLLPLAMLHEEDALARQTVFQKQLSKLAKGHRQEDLLKPTMIRFGINVRKCAILIAMSEGAPTVSLRHELIALEAAEEWLNTILVMVEQTTATEFTRKVDDIERFVARTGRVRMERVYGHVKDPVRFVDERVMQLVKEGRVAKKQVQGLDAYELVLKEAA